MAELSLFTRRAGLVFSTYLRPDSTSTAALRCGRVTSEVYLFKILILMEYFFTTKKTSQSAATQRKEDFH